MKDLQEFKDWLVIEPQPQFNQYGHFPFMMFSEDHSGKNVIAALALGEAPQCYKAFHLAMKDGAQRCYMSVDFPAMEGQIDTDFLAIFSFDGRHIDLTAIPYDGETGERLPEISLKDSEVLQTIIQHFSRICLEEAGIIPKEEDLTKN